MMKVESSPHIHSKLTTNKIMLFVLIALTPSAVWGCIMYGLKAVFVLFLSISSSLLTEWILNLISKEHTLSDLSATVTGLLVGMNLSPLVPFYVPIVASFVAIFIAKWVFGGLGCNWANPAATGRVFVFFSFSSVMSNFMTPRLVQKSAEIVSSATPLTLLSLEKGSGDIFSILSYQGVPVSSFASSLSQKFGLNPYIIDAFFGLQSGCIGEGSILLLLLGGIFLICTKVIKVRIPLVYILSYFVPTYILSIVRTGSFSPLPSLYLLFTGGLFLASFFMATDYVTSPDTPLGQYIFAIGLGLLTFILRSFGSFPEGVSLAILFMNMLTPLINRLKRKKFGAVKEEKK